MVMKGTAIGSAFVVALAVVTVPPMIDAPAHAERLTTQPTRVTTAVSARRVGPNDRFTVSTLLQVAAGNTPIIGEPVRLQWQRLGRSGWRDGPDATTGGRGKARWTLQTPESRRYRVVFAGTASYDASASSPRRVVSEPVVTADTGRDWVTPSGDVALRARVRPVYEGQPVILQRRADGRWRDVKRKRQDARGRVVFSVGGWWHYGSQSYRVAIGKRDAHAAAHSRPVRVRTVRLVTYVIETRGHVKSAMPSFRQRSAQIYADPRGWSRANVHFKRVRSGGAFSLVLSAARYVPTFAPICDRYWSCRVGRYVIINEDRWRGATPYFKAAGGTLREYRAMVINHETGHWFGLGHATCGGSGHRAPVMMQQSKGLYGCTPNAWPLPWEIALAY